MAWDGTIRPSIQARPRPRSLVSAVGVRWLRGARAGTAQLPRLPDPLTVTRRVSARGAIMVGGQKIQVGHIWPDRDESTRAAVDAVISAYLTEQRRNSTRAAP